MPMVVLVLMAALLVMPSANYHQASGLPLNSLPEFLALLTLVPVILWPWLRGRWCSWLVGRPRWQVTAGVVILFLGLVGKGALLVEGDYEGFAGCYRAKGHSPPSGPCEKSYDNPLGLFGATRIDPHLDFGPGTWNLSFLNDLRFNYYWWVGGSIVRERIPFTARWLGTVQVPVDQDVRITYVGEGRMWLGPARLLLPPAYDQSSQADVRLPAGRHSLIIFYEFDDGYRSGMPEPGPEPTFQVSGLLDGKAVDLQPWPADIVPRVIGRLIDLVALAAIVTLAAFYARVLGPTSLALGLAMIAAVVVYVASGAS